MGMPLSVWPMLGICLAMFIWMGLCCVSCVCTPSPMAVKSVVHYCSWYMAISMLNVEAFVDPILWLVLACVVCLAGK